MNEYQYFFSAENDFQGVEKTPLNTKVIKARFGTQIFRKLLEDLRPYEKDCPFGCGSDSSVEITGTREGTYRAYVECWECEARGPDIVTEWAGLSVLLAIQGWNKRK